MQYIFCNDGSPCVARLARRSVYVYALSTYQSSPKSSGVGTLSTSIAVLLFNLSNPTMSYWPLEFPAIWLSVLGVDLVFSAGTLFIATFALPHEQSMAGALFNTMIQVNPFCPPESNQNIDESLFFFFQKKQLGISFGITVTTFVFDKVTRATPTGADMILSYQYATWTSGAFGLIGIYLFYTSLFLIFLLALHKILYDFSVCPWCSIL